MAGGFQPLLFHGVFSFPALRCLNAEVMERQSESHRGPEEGSAMGKIVRELLIEVNNLSTKKEHWTG
jgi:hypothetical protein